MKWDFYRISEGSYVARLKEQLITMKLQMERRVAERSFKRHLRGKATKVSGTPVHLEYCYRCPKIDMTLSACLTWEYCLY